MNKIILETERLQLREISHEDCNELLKSGAMPKRCAYFPRRLIAKKWLHGLIGT